MNRLAPVLLAALMSGALSFGAEQVVLANGFRIRAERHDYDGNKVKLHTSTGLIELESNQVAAIEVEEYVAPPPAPRPPEVTAPPTGLTVESGTPPAVLLKQAAARYGLPPEFLASVARAESGMEPGAVSPKGAIGLMQLMPATAARLNADPRDPAQNVDAGARHLRDLLIEYGGSTHKALAAYNAGAAAVNRYNGVPPYAETRGYVEKVLRHYQKLTRQLATAGGPAQLSTPR